LWRAGGVELRDLASPELLCPAGRVLHLRHLSSPRPSAHERSPAAFTDIQLSARMLSDHLPSVYVHALERLIFAAEEEELMASGDSVGAAAHRATAQADAEAEVVSSGADEQGRADASVLAMLL
jgi:hypothetical protein